MLQKLSIYTVGPPSLPIIRNPTHRPCPPIMDRYHKNYQICPFACYCLSTFCNNPFMRLMVSITDREYSGKPILVCEHYKKQWHSKDECWKGHGRSPRGNKHSSNEQQNSGRTDVREIARTSQPTGSTASQINSPTQGPIAQPRMPQSLGLISVDRKNPWILDSMAIDHLTGLEFGKDDWHSSIAGNFTSLMMIL
ncbi:Beta-galactosidase [Cucumis melo var. makuwa]|uniref:Beta-galactosidase n=1 Tax=Cucumis melo var. makuwa TaxID=1194695 RepID=A0A5D3DEW6_CUCMM|nr:Beta-galactosidase [Cucumis melo var. makuwa]